MQDQISGIFEVYGLLGAIASSLQAENLLGGTQFGDRHEDKVGR